MSEPISINVEEEKLIAAIKDLRSALEPMVPYNIDPLEFCRAAHEAKDKHVRQAIRLLLNGVSEHSRDSLLEVADAG